MLKLADRCEKGEQSIPLQVSIESAIQEYCNYSNATVVEALERNDIHLSLDAVAALEKELLPEKTDIYLSRENGWFEVNVCPLFNGAWYSFQSTAKTEQLARLSALLKSLAEMEE